MLAERAAALEDSLVTKEKVGLGLMLMKLAGNEQAAELKEIELKYTEKILSLEEQGHHQRAEVLRQEMEIAKEIAKKKFAEEDLQKHLKKVEETMSAINKLAKTLNEEFAQTNKILDFQNKGELFKMELGGASPLDILQKRGEQLGKEKNRQTTPEGREKIQEEIDQNTLAYTKAQRDRIENIESSKLESGVLNLKPEEHDKSLRMHAEYLADKISRDEQDPEKFKDFNDLQKDRNDAKGNLKDLLGSSANTDDLQRAGGGGRVGSGATGDMISQAKATVDRLDQLIAIAKEKNSSLMLLN
jgi:hypothetical protein